MATRIDVAKRAGVSPTTVSRVINDNGYVAADVRKRVLEAIEFYHYVPNKFARVLRTRQKKEIACITHSITNPFYGEVVLGIEEVAFQNGYTFSLYNANFHDRDYRRVLEEGFYGGLIVLSPVELSKFVRLEQVKEALPTVVYWDWRGEAPVPAVYVQLQNAMREMVHFLLSQGHREILFLGHDSSQEWENPRLFGYRQAMQEAGLDAEKHVTLIPEWQDSLQTGYTVMKKILQSKQGFTAVAASTDLLAIGAMRALQEAGLRVPADVSVAGVDNLEISALVTPSLTTVHLPKREIGQRLMQLLLQQIQGVSHSLKDIFPYQLMVRESVGAFRPSSSVHPC
ncbi:LacI family transcriptional regulator [Alicyclobacillus sp. TC]|uniref:Transcriptional regulator, LacI family n=2 Tax=Alicyclobacillus tolerans TaxID=90970 RepID=A0A1M6KH65_9BACL|nr:MULTISPECIES: LacI family DNA-binding transcriptional regulator [Alicyclobacillus]MDP9727212.1 DNA-binding LacI/PurR family transcriptional regulator [Alicyclobacillus tengchongensis]QRF22973.1 LacI family transcriptional regulator [Alicyclobacillus sp. TC]SHJ58313.1 transcriptional regulator, LacI family [Alicyclobacillus montanus]